MDKQALHALVDGLNHTNWHVRAIVHALIDLGRIQRLECQYEECIMDTRQFRPRAGSRGHEGYSLTIDHIDPRGQGGSHRPENLRVIHASCNVSRGLRIQSDVTLERRRAARAAFLADPERSAKWRESVKGRPKGWNKAKPGDRRLNRGDRALTDEQIVEAKALIAEGWTYAQLVEKYRVSRSTMHLALRSKGAYAKKSP